MLLLDSNMLIYLSKELISIDDILEDNQRCAISVISYMEVLGYDFDLKEEEDFICSLLNYLEIIYIDESIANKVIKLRKNNKIKLPDAIICASAMVNHATLVSNDIRLKVIPGLILKSC